MYERSAIVLERYMEKILKLNKDYNLKKNSENYNELIQEIENYQNVTEKELEVIQEFDDIAKEIENLQEEQSKLYKANKRLEEERAQLFTELGEEAEVLEIKLKRIEETIDKNQEKLKDIRIDFIKYLADFSRKQVNRNKCEKARRIGEANHISYIEKMNAEFEEIDVKDVVSLKDFINFEKEQIKQEALAIMIKNGKNERVKFNQEVLKRAIKARIDIAEKEAECYIQVYDKMKKLLAEPDSEAIRLNKYQKTFRDTSVKLAFLNAEREYIVAFLDYERMTSISGERAHKRMMIDACNNFELDIMQIEKLYELIMREINNRSTKKGYNQLYNKTYLQHIEDKEKNFEQEVNNVNISMGTVINSNYWRIEGIKNIYNVFQEEVSKKFNRDLSEYKIEEVDEEEEAVKEVKRYSKEKSEEQFKQIKYDENGKYQEADYEEEDYDELEQEEYEDEDDYEEESKYHQYKIEDYREEENNDEQEEYYEDDNELEEEDYDEEDYEDDEEYEDEEIEEENKEDDYEEDKKEEKIEKPSYKEPKEEKAAVYNKYKITNKEETEEEEDDYKAYNHDTFNDKYRNTFLDDDDDYENVYEYKYDDDYERHRRIASPTVISFDDEESLDALIANSRRKAAIQRANKRNNKGIFNKLFKKP